MFLIKIELYPQKKNKYNKLMSQKKIGNSRAIEHKIM